MVDVGAKNDSLKCGHRLHAAARRAAMRVQVKNWFSM
jgi:hypothetical protein